MEDLMSYAADRILEYYINEFQEYVDLDTEQDINLAYTTTEDEEHEIQVSLNLQSLKLIKKVDDQIVDVTKYETLQDLINNELEYLDFDTLCFG